MIKDIKYSGYSTIPSDYECTDGDLAMSMNLVQDNGAMAPVFSPKEIMELAGNEQIVLIHSVPGQKNYIIKRVGIENSFSIWWLQKSDTITNTAAATKIGDYIGYRDIVVVGNTIAIATDSGVHYALWKDNGYIQLNDKPPFIVIDFGMYKVAELNDAEKFTIPARCAASWEQRRDKAEKAELAEFTQMAYGLLLSKVYENVTSVGYFYQPFFIRYAYRLFDGSYSWHSAPILMLPTIIPPIIKYSDDGTHPAADGTLEASLTLSVPYFGLAYRILTNSVEKLANWSDIISGIDIFISAPIYTYDQSKDLPWRPVAYTRDILANVSPDQNRATGHRPGWTVADDVFVGHYADTISGSYVDHTMKTATSDNPGYFQCLNILQHPEFHRNVESEHTFYKIAELDVKDIKAMQAMERLKLKDDDLSTLVTRATLPDDYQSHHKIVASSLFAYNSRLNLAGIDVAPAQPFPMRSIMQFGNPNGTTPSRVRITVWTRLNGTRCLAVNNGRVGVEANRWLNPENNFPRYIYYPDASAYKMEIYISESQKYIINLTPHDFLNGAYWYRGKEGMSVSSVPTENAESETAQCAISVNVASKIYTSEVNNPFLFPATGINTVGNGEIVALSSVVKALSQGQFGQFPLYAFTTEGVWALEVSSTGGFISRQPVTRDVCINPHSILQIDTAVLFATNRGIMLLQGASSTCISDALNADAICPLSHLPYGLRIMAMAGFSGNDINIIPFSEFIATCRMAYDYPHQRIIVYRDGSGYAYIYSIRSKSWGMMYSNLCDTVNSYPEALAITDNRANDGTPTKRLVNFSQTDQTNAKCLLLTRPIKLEAPDVLKTIDTVIQRGQFQKSNLQCVLYGSRDLYNWHLIWSSKDHYLRGFRGTPYKYFRIACIATLSDNESIYGASIQYNPRLTDQPR